MGNRCATRDMSRSPQHAISLLIRGPMGDRRKMTNAELGRLSLMLFEARERRDFDERPQLRPQNAANLIEHP